MNMNMLMLVLGILLGGVLDQLLRIALGAWYARRAQSRPMPENTESTHHRCHNIQCIAQASHRCHDLTCAQRVGS